jgi:cell fate regulator YaaT (PSP1 superfamily)
MEREYLVSYGTLGDFGRFRAVRPLSCRRGDHVVLRTHRGVEIGEVLRDATPAHAHFLPNTTLGSLLRLADHMDAQTAESMCARVAGVCEEAQRQAASLGLPLVILDAELLLDGEHVVLHFLRGAECDVRPFVSGLSTALAMHVLVEDLTGERKIESGCGSCGAGECGSCGSGGCGSCGSAKPKDVQAHFSELREQMLGQSRVPLL